MPLTMNEAELKLMDLALGKLNQKRHDVIELRGKIARHMWKRQEMLESRERWDKKERRRRKLDKLPADSLHRWVHHDYAELSLRPRNVLEANFRPSTPMANIAKFVRSGKLRTLKNLGIKSEHEIIDQLKRTGYLGEDD